MPRPRNCGISREGLPRWGYDYDLARWATEDTEGNLVWHETEGADASLPSNHDWDDIRMVTLNMGSVEGEEERNDFRNYRILPERPLDPYESWRPGYKGPHKCGRYFDTLGAEGYYDLDNLAFNALISYGLWMAGE